MIIYNWYKQYRESLKVVEAEETFDLLIYRPLAFLFVKATYPTNLTPNQVSSIAMFFGVIAGIFFGFGTHSFLILGSVFYFLCNVLDCADGQIARLKKNGTKVGRIVDGFIDYVVSVSVFIGIGIGMTKMNSSGSIHLSGNQVLNIHPDFYIWLITVLAGFSSALQAFYFDFYRNKFLEVVYEKFSSLEDEIKEFEDEKMRIIQNKEPWRLIDKFLIDLYLKYTNLQLKLQLNKKNKNSNYRKPDSQKYYSNNKLLLRLWSFNGSTTHITICIFCAFINNTELFLLICVLPLNILMIVLYVIQKDVDKKLNYR